MVEGVATTTQYEQASRLQDIRWLHCSADGWQKSYGAQSGILSNEWCDAITPTGPYQWRQN
jgi:hypothetical protein